MTSPARFHLDPSEQAAVRAYFERGGRVTRVPIHARTDDGPPGGIKRLKDAAHARAMRARRVRIARLRAIQAMQAEGPVPAADVAARLGVSLCLALDLMRRAP